MTDQSILTLDVPDDYALFHMKAPDGKRVVITAGIVRAWMLKMASDAMVIEELKDRILYGNEA